MKYLLPFLDTMFKIKSEYTYTSNVRYTHFPAFSEQSDRCCVGYLFYSKLTLGGVTLIKVYLKYNKFHSYEIF